MWAATVDRLTAGATARWLLPAGWPGHLALAVCVSATGVFAIITSQSAVVTALLTLCLHYIVGLCGSFALHELGHALVLLRADGGTSVTLERTAWRISVRATGAIRGRDAFLAALAGPGGCAVAGGILLLACPHALLHVWFFAHAVFLLPVFGDGRALISGARRWDRRLGEITP